MANREKFVIAGLFIIVAVVYLIVSSTGATANYFITIEELQEMGTRAVGRNLTISGAVLGDSIIYDASKPQVRFTIAQVPGDPEEVKQAGGLEAVLHQAANDPNAARLEVVYNSVKPDMLKHEAQAIIRGQLGEDGIFHANDVLLKCPSKYEEDVPEQAQGA